MPTLPSITVTAPQLAKCVEAFTDADGYKAWLKAALRDEVARRTARALARNLTTVIRPVARLLTFPPAQVVPSGRTAHL